MSQVANSCEAKLQLRAGDLETLLRQECEERQCGGSTSVLILRRYQEIIRVLEHRGAPGKTEISQRVPQYGSEDRRTSSRANITLSGKKRRKLLKQLRHMEKEKAGMEVEEAPMKKPTPADKKEKKNGDVEMMALE
ncbi:uncharacterized protein C11orf98 homolog isoform X1 [Neoarius graeffei]|uniref:uncharacterized protein C11orf98 homolog isoform X1 n=1 Tax=Neoarius graeffei TaxID=443677 RepID=UPI00298D1032|nr:uncharacterized protein C11orf98 homolog isoform X1 [Neoarius graeffei]